MRKSIPIDIAPRCGWLLLLISGLVVTVIANWPAHAKEEINDNRFSVHDYRAKIRGSAWFVYIDGDFETETPSGSSISIDTSSDLNFDSDPYTTILGEAGLRFGKHDLWITGTYFNQTEKAGVGESFEFKDIIIDVGTTVKTKIELTDINFRYGYSFWTFEEIGFRLGPYVAVSYTSINFKMTEVETGQSGNYKDTYPVPTLGVHGEYPWGSTVFVGNIGGFYYDSKNFSGTGFRAEVSATWRPQKNVGFYGGLYAIYTNLDFGDEEIDDFLFFGPSIGLEFRF